MTQFPIKVLLVEDSIVAVGIYQKILDSSPEVTVVGTANDGEEALALIPQLQPQVICTDLQMPRMDGLELIRRVMAQYPLPMMVLSNYVRKEDIDNVFELLSAGAIDVMPKPQTVLQNDSEQFKKQLITKIKVLANKKVSIKPLA